MQFEFGSAAVVNALRPSEGLLVGEYARMQQVCGCQPRGFGNARRKCNKVRRS